MFGLSELAILLIVVLVVFGAKKFPELAQAQAVASLGIPDLDALIDGYVDGWIPDGWITLGQ